MVGELTNAAPGYGTVQLVFALSSGANTGGTTTWVATSPAIDQTNGTTGTMTIAAYDVAWRAGAADAALHQDVKALAVEADPLVAQYPFATTGCLPSGSPMGGSAPVTFSRNSAAENTIAGSPVSCGTHLARVGDDGLVLESTRVQLVATPLAPGVETKSLVFGNYHARIEGAGTFDVAAAGTAIDESTALVRKMIRTSSPPPTIRPTSRKSAGPVRPYPGAASPLKYAPTVSAMW